MGPKGSAGNGAGIVYRHDSDTAMPGSGLETAFITRRGCLKIPCVFRQGTLGANMKLALPSSARVTPSSRASTVLGCVPAAIRTDARRPTVVVVG